MGFQLASRLVAGSPSQLSPCSTISNGPAPTIPEAPLSPYASNAYNEQFDWLNHQFEQLNSGADVGASMSPPSSTQLNVQLQQHSYRCVPISKLQHFIHLVSFSDSKKRKTNRTIVQAGNPPDT